MNPFIKTCFLVIAYFAISITTHANDGTITPAAFTTTRFIASVTSFDSIITANATAKVCACQILNMQSNNHNVKNAVVFAEKTISEGSTDLEKAMTRLEKEKRILRSLFYNKIQVIAKTTAETDCNTLFLQMKKKQANLLLYEVLNADIMVR
jgi:ActR/RegA family two-component response regulator